MKDLGNGSLPVLLPDKFDNEIKKNQINFVLFGIKSCSPCEKMKQSIDRVRPKFPNVDFWYFPCRTLSSAARAVEKDNEVKPVPVAILFKNGKSMGRLFGSKNPIEIEFAINTVLANNPLAPDPEEDRIKNLFLFN